MKYLFGDTTPFPLEENFIETLQALTDCCVSLLRIDGEAQTSRRAADQARAQADKEVAELERLAVAVKGALTSRMGQTDQAKSPAEYAAERLALAVDNTVAQHRTGVLRKRDRAVTDVGLERIAQGVTEALEVFLRDNQLPHSDWRLRWKGSLESAEAHVSSTAECGLQAVMEVAIPSRHRWSKAVQISQLAQGLNLELPGDRGWLGGGPRLRSTALGKLAVTQLEVSEHRKVLVLSRGKRKLTNAYEISIPTSAGPRSTVKRLDGGEAEAEATELEGRNADAVMRLWSEIEDTVEELTDLRETIVLATLDNRSVRDIARPQTIAEAILESAGPLVREMRRRSRMPGEITLKRELGCGRREELFIPKEDLQRRFGDLEPAYRKLFEAYGLEATGEISLKDLEASRKRERASAGAGPPPAPKKSARANQPPPTSQPAGDKPRGPHTIPRQQQAKAKVAADSDATPGTKLIALKKRGLSAGDDADTNVRDDADTNVRTNRIPAPSAGL